ncbi:MAG: PadR family transcriptional regulator [Halorhabdus sp.]
MTETASEGDDDVRYLDLSAFQRDVLLVLYQFESRDTESYGLAIKRQLEERYAHSVNHGRLYPNLDKLVEWGLAERGQIDERTNRYTLTERGRALLEAQAERLDCLLEED